MTKRPATSSGVAVFVVVAVALVIVALRPGSTTVVVDDRPPIQPADDGTAVIHALRAPGGFGVFGWQIVDPTHTVEIQFLAGPGCSDLLVSGEPWPTTHPECTTEVDVVGTVAGLGVTSSGRSLVGVEFPVSADCFAGLERGMAWPPPIAGCGD